MIWERHEGSSYSEGPDGLWANVDRNEDGQLVAEVVIIHEVIYRTGVWSVEYGEEVCERFLKGIAEWVEDEA